MDIDGINVLSLFDGMSCGQIALDRAGIKVENYYASEIKKSAVEVTLDNYPDTIQLGDIRDLDTHTLPKIDLLIGGSPCQDLSRANRVNHGLEGEKSSLFYEYCRVHEQIKPKYFLFENVVMDKEDYRIISDFLGVDPVRINSSLVSAQLRDRLYWTNIGPFEVDLFGNRTVAIPQPVDKHIMLQSILDSGFVQRIKSRGLLRSEGSPLKTPAKMWRRYKTIGFTTLIFDDPSFDWEKGIRYFSQAELERLQTVPAGYTKSLTRNKAADLLGDGWTIDVIAHIFGFLNRSALTKY